jgi:hypothetical protein
MGNGSSGSYTAALSTNIKNFAPIHRGKVVGVLAAVFGISSAVFSSIYRYIFMGDLVHFILFMAIATGAVPLLIGFVFINVVKPKPVVEEAATVVVVEETQSLYGTYDTPKLEGVEDVIVNEVKPQEVVPKQYHPGQMIITIDFWLFATSLFAGIGSGLVVINSMFLLVSFLT